MPHYERDTNINQTYTCTCHTNGCKYVWNGVTWQLDSVVYGVQQGTDKTVKIGNTTIYIGYPSSPKEYDIFYDSYTHRICRIYEPVSASKVVLYSSYDSTVGATAAVINTNSDIAVTNYARILNDWQPEIVITEKWDGELWELGGLEAQNKYGYTAVEVELCFTERVIYWLNTYLKLDGADKELEEMWYGSDLAQYRANQMASYTLASDWHNQADIKAAAAACGYPDFFNGFAECAAGGWGGSTIDATAKAMVKILYESPDHWSMIKSPSLQYVQAGIAVGNKVAGNPYGYVCCILLATEDGMVMAWPET